MAVLEPAAVDAPAVEPAPASEAPKVETQKDPMKDAAAVLYPDPNAQEDAPERDAALPPDGETPEQKAAREAAEKRVADEKAKAEGAPEAYEDFTAPEGVELLGEPLEIFKSIAKEDNLSQSKAQRYIDAAVKLVEARDAQVQEHLTSVKEGWVNASKTDKEFGGDKLKESLSVAQKALKEFGSPELNELVVGAGLGDHPEFIRLLYRVGKKISEAPVVNGGAPAAQDAASILYPSLKRKA